MNRLLSFLLLVFISEWCKADRMYIQDKLIRLHPKVDSHINYLRDLEDNGILDFWTEVIAPNRSVDVHVRADQYRHYVSQFEQSSLPFDLLVDDLQEVIDNEQEELTQEEIKREAESRLSKSPMSRIVGTYASYNDTVGFLQEKANADSQHVRVVDIGKTFENRTIKAIELKFNSKSTRNIWIDCGIHAREWISPATCVWMIDKLLTDYYNNDNRVKDLLQYWNVYIVPSLNPDGYEYSRTSQRLWRKSRAKYTTSTCYGIDLNRNYPLKWMTGGASSNPCSETYAGSKNGSEIETQGVVNFMTAKNGTWDMYMSFHSYGQWWFTPYGYSTALPPNYSTQLKLAQEGAKDLTAVNNRKYDLGTVARLLYIASGSTVDWAHDALGIRYSYTIELPPTQNEAATGFVLPVALAPGVCHETYVGMKTFLTAVKNEVLRESLQ